MYKTITFTDFVQAFRDVGREDQFSYDALKALFEYYDEENIELDVIAICCEWSEYSEDEVQEQFEYLGDVTIEDDADDASFLESVVYELESQTTIIPLPSGYLVQDF